MEVASKIVRLLLSIIALGAVVWLGIEEAKVGVNMSMWVYIILAGTVFGISGDDVAEIAKKWIDRVKGK